nr:MAG TPA: hypothetical protein [Inoviridae sp.]DAI32433.1 MAG TPA: hypothetical protein [Inoviridae sp.]
MSLKDNKYYKSFILPVNSKRCNITLFFCRLQFYLYN